MTRTFDGRVDCPHCGRSHTAETAFERWMRNHPELDSRRAGIVRFDCDVLLHRYLTPTDKASTRDIQCLMFVEVKTHGADVTPSQQDTLSLFAQVLRNRRTNMHQKKRGRHAEEHVPLCRAWSHLKQKYVTLRMYGGHLLQFEHESPNDDGWIVWDYKAINEDLLLKLLRFELDPDSMLPIDWRRRSSDFSQRALQKMLFSEQS